jgi:hypothetical protein
VQTLPKEIDTGAPGEYQWFTRSITEIQDALVKHGATGMLYKYEQGTGRIEALQFLLRIKNNDVAFSQRQGKRREAHDLLTPVYNWFTEGFDTADLIDAKALLHALERSRE